MFGTSAIIQSPFKQVTGGQVHGSGGFGYPCASMTAQGATMKTRASYLLAACQDLCWFWAQGWPTNYRGSAETRMAGEDA
eukprot:scaffold43466_cov18-Tisochrysis_lutea.AAC.1